MLGGWNLQQKMNCSKTGRLTFDRLPLSASLWIRRLEMQADEWTGSQVDVAIIGAGAAGIAAARHLQAVRPDLSILILEAGSRIGGRALSVRPDLLEGEPVDLGCGWLHGARTNAWRTVAIGMGMAIDETPAPWSEGGRRLQRDNAADAAIDAFFERVEDYDLQADMPLSDMLEVGNPWNARIEAIGTYLNGAALNQASLIDYTRYAPGEGPDWRVRDGYGTLIHRYGGEVPVRLESLVTHIDHRAADAVSIETNRGTLKAKSVIVTVSTNVLAAQKIRFTPALPQKVEAAAALPLGLANKLFLRVDPDADLPVDTQAYGSSKTGATGSYHIRAFGKPIIEAYFAGPLAHDLEAAGDQASLSFARNELAEVLGNSVKRHLAFACISGWAATEHIGGAYAYATPGASSARAVLAHPVDGRLYFAGEACSAARYSTAHGAYETGVAAAERIATQALKSAD
jgi:monoamine oxidase